MSYLGIDEKVYNRSKKIISNTEIIKVSKNGIVLGKKIYSLSNDTVKDYLFNYYNFASLPIATYYEESTDKVVVFYVKDNKELVYEYFDEVKKK